MSGEEITLELLMGAYYHLALLRGNKAKSDSKLIGEAYQWLKDCGEELERLKKRDRDAIDRIERLARSAKPHKLNSLASSMKEFSGKRFEKYIREGAPPEIYEVFCGPDISNLSSSFLQGVKEGFREWDHAERSRVNALNARKPRRRQNKQSSQTSKISEENRLTP